MNSSAAINRDLEQRQEQAGGVVVRLATIALWILAVWLALKFQGAMVMRQTWFAIVGFMAGLGAAMEAGGGYDTAVIAGLVAGAVTIAAKLLDIWWERRKTKGQTTQALSSAQQQSADRVAELTVQERKDLRELMAEVYGRERELLEHQMAGLQAQRTQDVAIIDSLSSQLRVAHERLNELEKR